MPVRECLLYSTRLGETILVPVGEGGNANHQEQQAATSKLQRSKWKNKNIKEKIVRSNGRWKRLGWGRTGHSGISGIELDDMY